MPLRFPLAATSDILHNRSERGIGAISRSQVSGAAPATDSHSHSGNRGGGAWRQGFLDFCRIAPRGLPHVSPRSSR
jgi:hypothetical protein